MEYIKLVNENPIKYTIEQFLQDHPDVNLYKISESIPDKNVLKLYDVYPLITTPPPVNHNGKVTEATPIKNFNGEWIQQWTIEEYFTEDSSEEKNNLINLMPHFLVNDKVRLERLNICHSCDRYKESTRQCKECGCFMDIKSKLTAASCPIGKWDKTV